MIISERPFKNIWNNHWVVIISRGLVGGIFVLAGLAKLTQPIEEFIGIARQWNIIADPWLTWYVTIVPWAEVVFGLLVIVGLWRRLAAGGIAGLLLSFIIGIVINMSRGRTLDECGCFGSSFSFGETFPELLWRDLVLLALTSILIITQHNLWSFDKWLKH
ncbi:MAG: DoxX family membrane protein [Candidatus Kerfeldbacteria bacterium]|nr:DoxX family membrane protein [Candidatus Kerfeldbacteria bacterium]